MPLLTKMVDNTVLHTNLYNGIPAKFAPNARSVAQTREIIQQCSVMILYKWRNKNKYTKHYSWYILMVSFDFQPYLPKHRFHIPFCPFAKLHWQFGILTNLHKPPQSNFSVVLIPRVYVSKFFTINSKYGNFSTPFLVITARSAGCFNNCFAHISGYGDLCRL